MIQIDQRPLLRQAMALAAAALARVPSIQSSDDPMRINLPPLLPAGPEAGLTPEALRAIAALYLEAELEQAGVILVTELLSESSDKLGLMSVGAATKLDDFSRRRRDWYDRGQRGQIFARLFGIGGAGVDSTAANNEFQRLFANLCSALTDYAEDLGSQRPPSAVLDARVRDAAVFLLINLTPRQYGNTLLAGRLIGEQLRQAVDVLNDPGIGTHFGSSTMWDTVRKILGAQTPDLGRLITRAQSGLRLLHWLASSIPRLRDSVARGPIAGPNDPVFVWAAQWLEATGLAQHPRRVF